MGNYHLQVNDIMHTDIATILEDATVQEAAAQMRFEGVRSLIVILPKESGAWGIVTYADITGKVIAQQLDPYQVHVHEIMINPAQTVPAQLSVRELAQLFWENKFGHAPVVDGANLVGVVSMTDLVTEVISEPE